ncbi:helix-turn-helix domain-containing protein [Lacticaseibacillus absianus]|uniref:helix-turn-helix domain-containing protein n=1 Tax=Lacticaseibacillus absianus TaxID=2729623 RepID=UPI0015C9EE65
MHYYRFATPPYPYYIEASEATYATGQRHIDRQFFEFFDLIFVTKGCLFLTEESTAYTLTANHGLILAPYLHHFSPRPVATETHFYWTHFLCPTHFTIAQSPSRSAFDQISLPNTFVAADPQGLISDFEFLCATAQVTGVDEVLAREQHLLNLFRAIAQTAQIGVSAAVSAVARRAVTLMTERYMAPEFNINRLKAQLNFDPTYVSRCVKSVYGVTAKQYLLDLRLNQAKLLLRSSNLPVGVIAERVGFGDQAHFSKVFKQQTLTTPSAFRDQYRR